MQGNRADRWPARSSIVRTRAPKRPLSATRCEARSASETVSCGKSTIPPNADRSARLGSRCRHQRASSGSNTTRAPTGPRRSRSLSRIPTTFAMRQMRGLPSAEYIADGVLSVREASFPRALRIEHPASSARVIHHPLHLLCAPGDPLANVGASDAQSLIARGRCKSLPLWKSSPPRHRGSARRFPGESERQLSASIRTAASPSSPGKTSDVRDRLLLLACVSVQATAAVHSKR